ncbi:MAG: Cell division coordinator CpoB [Chlamydiae bacterium]|nr:Cell division coordinator CpoB [Chlamydiota bacterium]
MQAQILFGQGRAQGSMQLLNELVAQKPLKKWEAIDQKFYLKVKGCVEHYFEDIFLQAERCYEGGLYSETIPLYYEILEAIEEGIYLQEPQSKLPFQVRSRIAYSEFENGQFAQAKEMLVKTKDKYSILFEPESFQQLIVSCRALKEYDQALAYCKEFFTYKYSPSKHDAIKYEMASIYYELGEKDKAEKMFTALLKELKDADCLVLSRFCLAKIALDQRKYEAVEQILHPDHFHFNKGSPLRYEWAYLRAEALYHRKQFEMSAAGFKESLMHPKAQNKSWYHDAYYNLGFCYLKLGEDNLSQLHSKEDFFHKAEEAFEHLVRDEKGDRAHLALAKTYLLQHFYLKDQEATKKVHSLFKKYKFNRLESRLEAGFILADMTSNLKQREKIYQALTADCYQNADNYGKSWYYRGIFSSQLLQSDNDLARIDEAISFFKKSYKHLKKNYPQLALASIKNIVTAYLNFSTQDRLNEGYEFLEQFFLDNTSLSKNNEFFAALCCLKAELCLKLMAYDSGFYLMKGLAGLEFVEQLPQQSKSLDRALFLKARLYYQHGDYSEAKNAFSQLVDSDSNSSYVADSLFWMAECNDFEQGSPTVSKDMRRRVFEEFADNPLAPEAYFLYFSFAQYLEGGQEAIKHLEQLKERFSSSPYVIASYYLQGISKRQVQEEADGRVICTKDLASATALFEKARAAFTNCWENNLINPGSLHYFVTIYYRSALAEAQSYLERASESTRAQRHVSFEKSLALFNEVYQDFSDSKNPLASIILANEKYPKILKEAEFGRAIASAKNGDVESAEDAFGQMIDHYRELKIDEDHYLSRAWYELALIAMAKQEYSEALEYFLHAEQTTHKHMLNADHKIDLGIQQSLCYRYLNQFDMAMLTLSKVINDGVISNLRVKAMVFRAEIYELQGRKDLAQKQLEAAAKKGGEWSLVAQEKLVKEYGYNSL